MYGESKMAAQPGSRSLSEHCYIFNEMAGISLCLGYLLQSLTKSGYNQKAQDICEWCSSKRMSITDLLGIRRWNGPYKLSPKQKSEGKWACFNCVSSLSPEEVRASIQAPSTFLPSKNLSLKTEEVVDVDPMDIEETPPQVNVTPIQDLPVVDEPKPREISPVCSAEPLTPVGDNPPLKSDVEQSNIVSSTDPEEVKTKVAETVSTKPKNAFRWEKADVVEYIKSLGFPKEAIMFEEQEIDGPSLMVMSRTDLISSLKFKLGPALKIYAHVAKLQIQTLPSE